MSFPRHRVALAIGILIILGAIPALAQSAPDPGCPRTVTANVSALDQPFLINRLGAMMVEGMVYALDRDVVPISCPSGTTCKASKGNARLRDGKRPRPLVLRANRGDCLSIHFTNLLSDTVAPYNKGIQPATRQASIHVAGMQLVKSIRDDGSYVGVNQTSLVKPGDSITYLLRATEEGTFLLNSEGAAWGGLNFPNDGAQVTAGLFGAVNVEPDQAIWLRSQITHDEMMKAVDKTKGNNGFTPLGQPLLDFKSPVLNILNSSNEIVYSDLTAVIAGPASNGYQFPDDGNPNTSPVPYEPLRKYPFREFTIEYHELGDPQQAFPIFNVSGASLTATLQASGDQFAINYGTGGIGAEILANRFGVGPMGSCADCKFEEFFLSSWTVGDPAMVVDYPANAPCSGTTFKSPDPVTTTAKDAKKANCTPGVKDNAPADITPLRKATKALYPDDPSNVYHSYINDRVIFRTLHAGTGVSHVHHLHAHQWFHSPNSDGSTYLDSQLINPGSAYTMEIAHLGSGNLNKVVGDSIFHCHFYPHFAAGMWAHWRSHDVFEMGTELDSNGRPKTGWNRAQPDGEIAVGTPIPALVPMPSLPMAPVPARVQIVSVPDPNNSTGPPVGYRVETNPDDLQKNINPGYPFFIPGVAGMRAPHPPMDFAVQDGQTLDGGLPRHVMINAKVKNEKHNYLDFSKDLKDVNAYKLPEDGTDVEKVAMAYHAQCTHPTFTSTGAASLYRTNGRPPVSGAPYADPGLISESDAITCEPVKEWITYRAAVIETDTVINKLGWHYPQTRFLTLWQDVQDMMSGAKPPEPFFFRGNNKVGVNYWHTNLVPAYYNLDDYQVRTPTDIIGQHIHLVKFDVTSSDGAANGFNYEDGTLSYQEVKELIHGINECGGLGDDPNNLGPCKDAPPEACVTGDGRACLEAQAPPKQICPDPTEAHCQQWFGAQTTVQRWYSDHISSPSDSVAGERTLRTVFTHDHFGPSTHQQTGLYAAFLVEPTDSKWYKNELDKDGKLVQMGTRYDGGPTSWAAVIETPYAPPERGGSLNTYREFALALQDFQFAYTGSSPSKPSEFTGKEFFGNGTSAPVVVPDSWASPTTAVQPPPPGKGPTNQTAPLPQLVSTGPTPGMMSFNYRNEPLPYRIAPPATGTGSPESTDLSYVFSSAVTRNIAALNNQPTPGSSVGSSGFKFPAVPLTAGMKGGDPYTPLLRAYEGDRVQMRIIVGAHMLPHDFTVQGMKWRFEPNFANSGYRSNQSMGISEHFEFIFNTPRASPAANTAYNWSDYLYMPDASNQAHGLVDGTWGLFRAYKTKQDDLPFLSTNPTVAPLPAPTLASGYSCPPEAPIRAITINALAPDQMTINSRGVDGFTKFPGSKIFNQYPLMYSFLSMTPPGGQATAMTPSTSEPLIIRANSGECVALTLQNQMNPAQKVFTLKSTIQFAQTEPTLSMSTSYQAGINPALLSYDVMRSGGTNVGWNPPQTVGYQKQSTYYWYAGQTWIDQSGRITGYPIELGPVNLTPSDPLEQDLHGLVGGMIVEPANTIACYDDINPTLNGGKGVPTYASAYIYRAGAYASDCTTPGSLHHREFVMLTQDDMVNLYWPASCYCAVPKSGANRSTCTQSECTVPIEKAISNPLLIQTTVNYRTEPMPYRFNATSFVNLKTVYRGFSDGLVLAEPQTPIFAAARHTPTRFHLLHPGGSGNQQILALHGHVWQELPYTDDSSAIGNNRLSQWLGARDNYGTNTAYSIILEDNGGAGGKNGVKGDYIYRTTPANFLTQGLWGIFRVGDPGRDTVSIAAAQISNGGLLVSGSSTAFLDNKSNAKNGERASTVSLYRRTAGTTGNGTLISNNVTVGYGGLWSYNEKIVLSNTDNVEIVAVSPLGGTASMPLSVTELPAATPADAQTQNPVGETIRFLNEPRSRTGQPDPVTQKREEGLLAPAQAGLETAPKSAPVETTTPPPPPNP